MAYGDGSDDTALRQAWHEFCDHLRLAGDSAFKDVNPVSPQHRADGFRFLTQNLGQAFDLALETRNVRFPAFHRFVTPTRKLGSDCADAVYQQAWIDGSSTYRVWGRRGTARFWNLTVQGPRPASGGLHEPFGDTPEATMLGDRLVTDTDGRFELFVGGAERGPNWLPTTSGSRKLFFRQFFDSWDEEPADVMIERLDMDGPPSLPDPERMIEAMRWAGAFVAESIAARPEFLWRTPALCDSVAINRFNAGNLHARLSPDDAQRGRFLTQMRWSLRPDEALILEFEAFDGFWTLTNEAVFGNSMDHRYRPVSYAPSRTVVDQDSRIRLVMAHDDPGFANWIDTSGFEAGTLTLRVVQCLDVPTPVTRVVATDELRAEMPRDSPRVSAAERDGQRWERFHATARRSGFGG